MSLCSISSADGWLVCMLPAGHAGPHDLRSVHIGDAQALTADTITDDQLRELFAKHCECRPLDLNRSEDDHAAIHDCDTAILSDVQCTFGIGLFDDSARIQAAREARGRCAEVINAARSRR